MEKNMKAKMNKWSGWIRETRPEKLIAQFEPLLIECGFNICDTCGEFFKPFGFTFIFLLSESHFAIHTFPEENKTYIELSSCIDIPFNRFVEKMNKHLI